MLAAGWHPTQQDLFASAAEDGSLLFWLVGQEGPQAEERRAHETQVTTLIWHPLGHVLTTGGRCVCAA